MSYLSRISFPRLTIIIGVIRTTDKSMRNTQRIKVFVPLMTESFVKSSQIMSDYGNACEKVHLRI